MPWDLILPVVGTSSLTVILILVIGLIFIQKTVEQAVSSAASRYQLSLNQAEEAYKKALEYTSLIDIDLRANRKTAYKIIWKDTGILPRWPRAKNVTYADILEFSNTLREWFFETGGLWLSSDARAAYGDLQNKIWLILTDALPENSTKGIKTEHYDEILECCSALRKELTDDLLSRKAAPV